MNFHINQLANNDKTIIENLTVKSKYHSQFRTGISNGMLGGRLPPAMETADVFQRLSGNRHGSPKIWRIKYFQLSE